MATLDHSPLPRIPRSKQNDYEERIVIDRRELCEKIAARPLPHLSGKPVPLESARNKVENLIGYAQVPVGIAGPMIVHTTMGRREVYVPMATTEGAIVASHSRGMRLLNCGGGARARVIREGYTQNPMLVYANAEEAMKGAETVRYIFDELAEIVSQSTKHGRLVSAEPQVLGRRLVLALVFTTGDAIGSNMGAKAAERCSAHVAEKTLAMERFVHGQDVEKRANSRALVEGRGRSTVCDVTIPRDELEKMTRTTPEQMRSILNSYLVGFAHLGTHNWTVQAANGLAAVLTACGQDIAYVTECATGFLDMEVTKAGDLYASVYLPSLLIGTVGGGCGQGTAAECLDILGVRGEGGSNTFAEILAATVLAGDLSILAAFSTHEFTEAHERLGKNRPQS